MNTMNAKEAKLNLHKMMSVILVMAFPEKPFTTEEAVDALKIWSRYIDPVYADYLKAHNGDKPYSRKWKMENSRNWKLTDWSDRVVRHLKQMNGKTIVLGPGSEARFTVAKIENQYMYLYTPEYIAQLGDRFMESIFGKSNIN